MRKFFLLGLFIIPLPLLAAAPPLTQRAAGRVLLQTDQRGQAWYVNPGDGKRYFLQNPGGCWELAPQLALGIRTADLNKLPAAGKRGGDRGLARRLSGRFLLATEQRGRLYFVSPLDSRATPLNDPESCWTAVLRAHLGVKTADLAQVPMNTRQITFDPAFNGVAAARLEDGQIADGTRADEILPIASLTKLMTAMVLLDHDPDWDQVVPITADALAYPQLYVDPGDVTSEVPFTSGDRVTVRDLWRAMLVASSNQAAGMLAGASSLTEREFVAAMNTKANALGLTRTRFTDPSGLDPYNVSTAAEMARLAAAAFSQPEIARTSVMGQFTIAARRPDGTARDIPVVNRNATLLRFGPDGAKSGFLIEAQRTVAVRRGETIAVVLHARSMKERNQLLSQLLADPR
ncbi:MAG: D-alanyl-D-alanine endopeptidase (penicillin-binding protein 7) [Parcubacteria group bacterium Gr01-1014_31]|nr:MAG: D-alanyl-D-alanine endopeptidase (penicillin-binding protein 7) [Parcubacteria group bacterium Gr01-1014_31]